VFHTGWVLAIIHVFSAEYWGEMGHMRLEMGKNLLGIESDIAWATPGEFTVLELSL
jgi:hypothetical protein